MSKTIQFDRYKTMTAVTKGEIQVEKGRTLVNDDMKGEGVPVEWFDASKKDAGDGNEAIAHLAHYDATRTAIFDGFDPVIQKLLNKPIEEVLEGNAPGQRGTRLKKDDDGNVITNGPAIGTRLYWQMQIGTKVLQWKKSYATYLAGPTERGANGRKPDDEFLLDWLAKGKNRVNSSKGAKGIDLELWAEWLEDCPIK